MNILPPSSPLKKKVASSSYTAVKFYLIKKRHIPSNGDLHHKDHLKGETIPIKLRIMKNNEIDSTITTDVHETVTDYMATVLGTNKMTKYSSYFLFD
jgi:hypothetical protein